MTHRRLALGKNGEDLAVRRLESLGYRLVERNYRCPLGEIDLVAEDAGCLVFVEIKTRQGVSTGEAKEAVTHRKQRQITRAALYYLKARGCTDARARFDVVAVSLDGADKQIEVVRDAFEPVQ
ncbi:MAG: YraN family protein [Thermodesulfobacteriota bacterium]